MPVPCPYTSTSTCRCPCPPLPAADDDGDVMVPTAEGPAFEVVEPEFTFEVLVHALRSPALLDDANEFLVAHPTWQCGEVKLGALVFVRPPLDDQPRRLTLRDGDAILVQRLDPAEGEATAQRTFRALLPTQLPAPSMRDGFGQIRYPSRSPGARCCPRAAPWSGYRSPPRSRSRARLSLAEAQRCYRRHCRRVRSRPVSRLELPAQSSRAPTRSWS